MIKIVQHPFLFLAMIYILRRKHLQTTVNYFVLNLAVADILVTLICLPPTLIVDFFEIWLLGKILCKFTPYLQVNTIGTDVLHSLQNVVKAKTRFSLGILRTSRLFCAWRPNLRGAYLLKGPYHWGPPTANDFAPVRTAQDHAKQVLTEFNKNQA